LLAATDITMAEAGVASPFTTLFLCWGSID
jgi:hypothetical protein